MYIGKPLLASEILNQPDIIDQIEDPYVVVTADIKWTAQTHEEVIQVITMMYEQGWDTVNITFQQDTRMVALLKNPRAKRKN